MYLFNHGCANFRRSSVEAWDALCGIMSYLLGDLLIMNGMFYHRFMMLLRIALSFNIGQYIVCSSWNGLSSFEVGSGAVLRAGFYPAGHAERFQQSGCSGSDSHSIRGIAAKRCRDFPLVFSVRDVFLGAVSGRLVARSAERTSGATQATFYFRGPGCGHGRRTR